MALFQFFFGLLSNTILFLFCNGFWIKVCNSRNLCHIWRRAFCKRRIPQLHES